MYIRPAHNDDLQTIFDIEQNTFPPQEAACLETFLNAFLLQKTMKVLSLLSCQDAQP